MRKITPVIVPNIVEAVDSLTTRAYPLASLCLVTRGEEMLLARNANWPSGMYSTLAGFVEAGESIEQTVHREVMEEVGLK